MTPELEKIRAFVFAKHISDAIPAMEPELECARGYEARVGELVNEAEHTLTLAKNKAVETYAFVDGYTETILKAKINAAIAGETLQLQTLKNIKASLHNVQMELMHAIKTRREEPKF